MTASYLYNISSKDLNDFSFMHLPKINGRNPFACRNRFCSNPAVIAYAMTNVQGGIMQPLCTTHAKLFREEHLYTCGGE